MQHIFRCARATWSVCRPFCSITTKKDAVSDCINKDSQYQNSKLVVNIFSQNWQSTFLVKIGSQYLAHIFCQYLIFLLFNCWWLPLQKKYKCLFLTFSFVLSLPHCDHLSLWPAPCDPRPANWYVGVCRQCNNVQCRRVFMNLKVFWLWICFCLFVLFTIFWYVWV